MGSLNNIPTKEIVDFFGCSTLIETGAGLGGSISFARKIAFKKIYSCEINEYLHDALYSLYEDDQQVHLYHSSSEKMLRELLPSLDDSSVLFWLDAHFPGADFGLNSYDDEKDESIRLPLETELRLIKKYRGNKDVIIIDDLRIYEDGPFSNGPAPQSDRLPRGTRSLSFINDLFSKSHNITRIYIDEGYILITPKMHKNDICRFQKISNQISSLLDGSEKQKLEAIRRTEFYFSHYESEPIFFKLLSQVYDKHLGCSDISVLSDKIKHWDTTLKNIDKNKKIIIYGTGFNALLVYCLSKRKEIDTIYFSSSIELMIGKIIDGKPILSMDAIFDTDADAIIIASMGSHTHIVDKINITKTMKKNNFLVI
ncbi:hypothetical protein [Aeromonas enteropelogenes]|uniref:hypothetical protein n=1 Tax=Aeromonas enteropelogenes TaxID=29489 RepID=UPI003B9FAA1D